MSNSLKSLKIQNKIEDLHEIIQIKQKFNKKISEHSNTS